MYLTVKTLYLAAYARNSRIEILSVMGHLSDETKKNPENLDFSHVGQAPAVPQRSQFEPPPVYQETGDAYSYAYATRNKDTSNAEYAN